jgi:hypothetical protein
MLAAKESLGIDLIQNYRGYERPEGVEPYYWTFKFDGFKGRPIVCKTAMGAIRSALKVKGKKWDDIKEVFEKHARQAAIECAVQAVETYNMWLSGDSWGVIVEKFDSEGNQINEDSCWGFLGKKYSDETLANDFESTVKRLKATPCETYQI